MSYVCLLEIHLALPQAGSLKGKRKEVTSLKAQIKQRFGASVAETADQDVWQRATLSVALVGRSVSGVTEAAEKLERFVHARSADGVRIERGLVSAEEVLG